MKNKVTIMLPGFSDVQEFNAEVSMCKYDVDLISGRYVVDAKSIMGIYSLDLKKPIELEAHTDDPSEFFAKINRFIVE
ncbi:MAG: HPr family phosphocarrier protein [Oscillospiraceae bacterium]|nr:HPr family phosphocarrier protein [Oscillospiraceae bacterium]MBQ4311029.1 HPr family phosphocarrier protein [Oscillospiraceae bacterium]MCR5167296.1 HPr family phosphocarrier protein [Oscillospiraceae bacterium]